MKPVRTNAMFVIKIFWNSHAIRYGWHGLVEGSVEYRNLLGVGKNFFCYFNTQVVGWIVKGCQRKELLYFLLYLFINNDGIGKTFSSMNDTMSNDFDFLWIFYNTNFFIYQ